MPDLAPPLSSAPAPAPASSTPPGTIPGSPSGAAPAATSAPWRAADTAPSWARGKTSEEILGIASTLVEMYNNGGTPTRAETPVAPAPAALPTVADDDYITGATLRQFVAAAAAPNEASIALGASANFGVVRQQYSQDFAKYGAEINAKLARVPKNLWTLDNLETVVKMVRSDHLDEIAHERAQQLVQGMEPTLRSNGAAAPLAPVTREASLDYEKINPEWLKRARAAGVTERTVEEFCRANDMEPAAFYRQFDTPMNRIVEDISQRRPSA